MGIFDSKPQKRHTPVKSLKDLFKQQNPEYLNNQRVHYSIVIGYTANGKDTFIYNLDNDLLFLEINGMPALRMGDQERSSTYTSLEIPYNNKIILNGYKSGCVLNTVGLADQNQSNNVSILYPENISKNILELLQESKSEINGFIDAIFVVCSVSDQTNKNKYEDLFKHLQISFGPSFLSSIIFILNKANLVCDKNKVMQPYKELAKRYNINHSIEFRGTYFENGNKSSRSYTSSEDDIENDEFIKEIAVAVQQIVPFSFKEASSHHFTKQNDLLQIQGQILKKSNNQGKELSSQVHIQNILNHLSTNKE